jgi:hypothetical protein
MSVKASDLPPPITTHTKHGWSISWWIWQLVSLLHSTVSYVLRTCVLPTLLPAQAVLDAGGTSLTLQCDSNIPLKQVRVPRGGGGGVMLRCAECSFLWEARLHVSDKVHLGSDAARKELCEVRVAQGGWVMVQLK